MSCALVLAALEVGTIELQLVSGARPDLVRVQDGSERAAEVSVEGIRLRRAMESPLSGWDRFAYDEAAEGLQRLPMPRDRRLRPRLTRARQLSEAFAAWDRFEHQQARSLLLTYTKVVAEDLGDHLRALGGLTSGPEQREPLLLFDLWRNAERRARQGRHDDAVARVYRLLEGTAQWLLRRECDIETADVPRDRLPAGFDASPGRDGRIQVGLWSAWKLVAALTQGAAADFFTPHNTALLGHLQVRNQSLLAHGFEPIPSRQWESLSRWCEESFLPVLAEEAERARVRPPPQLPDRYLWD